MFGRSPTFWKNPGGIGIISLTVGFVGVFLRFLMQFLAVGQTFGSPSTGIGMMIQTEPVTLPYELFTKDIYRTLTEDVYNQNKLTPYILSAINNLPGMHI